MVKKKIAFVVAVPITATAFLMDHIAALKPYYEIHLICNFTDEESLKSFEDYGLTCRKAPILRAINPFGDLKGLFALIRLFKKEKFDCVHSVTPKAGLLTALAGRLAGVPNCVHIFTGQVWCNRKGVMRALLKGMDKLMAACDTRLLVDGEGQRQYLIKEGILTEKNSVVPAEGSIAGIKLDRYVIDADVRTEERMNLGIKDEDIVYIFLGRDDRSLPHRFEQEVAFLDERPEYAIVSGPMRYFDDQGVFMKGKGCGVVTKQNFIAGTPFCHAPCMVRREAYEKVGGYTVDPKLLRVEDYHLWFKMYAAGYKGYMLEYPIYEMRDARDAVARRTFKSRLNEAYVKHIGYKMVGLPWWTQIYCIVPIIKGMMPKWLYSWLHQRKVC